MAFDPQNYDPGVLTGRVRPNVCKIQVQSYQDSLLCPARACDRFIIRAREILVANGVGNETGATQDIGCFDREILVYFEFHAVSSAGKSMEPSRANSAA